MPYCIRLSTGNNAMPVATRFALRTLRELKLLIYLSESGVSENVCVVPTIANSS